MSRVLLAIALLAAGLPAAAQEPAGAQEPAAPTLEDLFRYQSVSDAELSPDGTMVLYTLRSIDLEENETDIDIWLVRTAGDAAVRMTTNAENDTRPHWKPDGSVFAFTSERGEGEDARTALYLMSPTGGEPEQLYAHATNVGAFEWSPDGRSIAFTAAEEETQAQKDAEENGRDVEVEDGPETHTHLWVLDVVSREARRLTGADDATVFTVQSFAWSPDSHQLAFSAAASPNLAFSWKSDVYVIAAEDSASTPRKVTANEGPDGSPVWAVDGKSLYVQGHQQNGYRVGQSRLYRVALDTGLATDVTPGDLDPGTVVPVGDGVWFTASSATTSGLFWMHPDGSGVVRVTPEDGVYGDIDFSADGTRIVYTHETPTLPAELYTAALATRSIPPRPVQPVALTSHNAEMAKFAVGRTEVIQWQSTDGRQVDGVLVYPAGYTAGQRVPLVVKIHGGPAGAYHQNFQANGYGSNAQWYAADGYAMLMPNPRGSSGYGDDSQRSVIEDWGGLDFQDIMTGVDAVIARGIAHPDSLGVMGWSYGGYMTAWTVTQTDRFKAAVNGAGITEPIAMWGTQDIIQVFEGYFGGDPYDDGRWQVYQASSPLAHVRNVTTPTLMIHGRNDARVPPNQAQIFFRSLRALGVPTELVWLPRSGHGPSEPGLQFETALRQKQWMDRWIRGVRNGEPVTDS
ncbi:MAG: prolyl oligopeptidase family serine peptidase [Longimicrobiales bacterium]